MEIYYVLFPCCFFFVFLACSFVLLFVFWSESQMFLHCIESLICLFPTYMFIFSSLVYGGLILLGFQFSLFVIYLEVQLALPFLVWRFSRDLEATIRSVPCWLCTCFVLQCCYSCSQLDTFTVAQECCGGGAFCQCPLDLVGVQLARWFHPTAEQAGLGVAGWHAASHAQGNDEPAGSFLCSPIPQAPHS